MSIFPIATYSPFLLFAGIFNIRRHTSDIIKYNGEIVIGVDKMIAHKFFQAYNYNFTLTRHCFKNKLKEEFNNVYHKKNIA